MDTDEGLRLHDDFRPATDLDPARPPRWEHLIDDEGSAARAGHIAKFLGARHVATTDLDRVTTLTEAPADGRHVRHSITANGSYPAE
jgi:hypothetical protein